MTKFSIWVLIFISFGGKVLANEIFVDKIRLQVSKTHTGERVAFKFKINEKYIHNVWLSMNLKVYDKEPPSLMSEASCTMYINDARVNIEDYIVYGQDTALFYFSELPAQSKLAFKLEWEGREVKSMYVKISLVSDEGVRDEVHDHLRYYSHIKARKVSLVIEDEPRCYFW